MVYDRLNEKILEMGERIVAAVQRSVAIESVRGEAVPGAPYGPGPKAALEDALALGASLGLRTGRAGDRVGWVECGGGEEMAAALGHLDVVPAGTGWTYPPFGGEIHDGILYGRGVMDDKGPTIGAIFALKAIKDLGLPLDRRLRVLFGTDEERGSSCVDYYIQSGEELPVMGFTPDAEFPLIFFEKGITQFTIGKRITDPGDGRVLLLTGGEAANVVTPRCTLRLAGDFTAVPAGLEAAREGGDTLLTAVGKSAHGSTPELGVNAACLLFDALAGEDFGGDFQRMAGFIRDLVAGETDGNKLGVRFQDPETGVTTVNLGLVSYDGEELHFTLDVRYPAGGDAETVSRRISEAAAGYGLSVLQEKRLDMLHVPKSSALVRKLMGVYEAQTGQRAEPLAIGGGTYAKAFSNMVAFGPVFPGDPDVIHKPDERVKVTTLLRSIQLTAAALWELGRK